MKELQALALDVRILTENDEEIDLPELSQDEHDKPSLENEVEKDLKNVTLDIDEIINNSDEEEKKDDIKETIDEQTSTQGLDDIDLFDDFGDFDE